MKGGRARTRNTPKIYPLHGQIGPCYTELRTLQRGRVFRSRFLSALFNGYAYTVEPDENGMVSDDNMSGIVKSSRETRTLKLPSRNGAQTADAAYKYKMTVAV